MTLEVSGGAAAYLRVSPRGRGGEEGGLSIQGREIADWVRAEGKVLRGVWRDLCSGSTPVDERPGLQLAIGALRPGDVLVVRARSRLGRGLLVVATIELLVRDQGASIVATSAPGASGDDPEAQLIAGVLDVFSQYERARIRARTKSALAAKAAEGYRVGSVPYGWRAQSDGRLVAEPSEQRVIALVQRLRRRGWSFGAIASHLDHQRHRLPRSGGRWYPEQIRRICCRTDRSS